MLPHRTALLAAGAVLVMASACNAITGADAIEISEGWGGAAAGGDGTGATTGTGVGQGGTGGTTPTATAGGVGAAAGTGGTATGLGGTGGTATGTGATGGTGGTMTGTGTGTGTGGTGGSGNCTGMVPDFSLTDLNTTSATYNTDVSPRDYVGQISAWYFGNAL